MLNQSDKDVDFTKIFHEFFKATTNDWGLSYDKIFDLVGKYQDYSARIVPVLVASELGGSELFSVVKAFASLELKEILEVSMAIGAREKSIAPIAGIFSGRGDGGVEANFASPPSSPRNGYV